MADKKKQLTPEEKAIRDAEAQAKIAAARERQAQAEEYGARVSTMTRKQKLRELKKVEKTGSMIDAALAIALRLVLINTRVTRDEAFETVGGKKIFRPNWVNESGTLRSYLR